MTSRLAFALALCAAAPSVAEAQKPAPAVITTTGSATTNLRPTSAVVMLAIEDRSPSAATAAAENAGRQQRVLAALVRIGFSPVQARVTGYSVRADMDFQTGNLRGYQASASVSVSVSELGKLGVLIDTALAAGATGVDRITYSSDSATIVRTRMLAEAMASARRDAEALARAAGGRLGRLLDVSTSPLSLDSPRAFALQPGVTEAAFDAVAFAPRDVTVDATVYARWEMTF